MPKNKDFARVPPCITKASYPFKTLVNNNVFFCLSVSLRDSLSGCPRGNEINNIINFG